MRRWLAIGVALAGAAACRPSSIADAEAKGDVQWLDAEGSAAAVDALGRLADTNEAAVKALQDRARFDPNAYEAAWAGVKRNKAWGTALVHSGLQDPQRAESAAKAVDPKDPAAASFVGDAEASLARLASGGVTPSLALLLASVGPPAHDALVRRLADKATRGETCTAIASAQASADARATLRSVTPESRDDASCVSAVVSAAVNDDAMLKWIATEAEPGMLGAASKLGAIPCTRLHALWVDAIAARSAQQSPALTVPLAEAMRRCPATMDGVMADALRTKPQEHTALVGALDPYSADDASLKATCAALPAVLRGPASPIAKERASDALAHGCKGVP